MTERKAWTTVVYPSLFSKTKHSKNSMRREASKNGHKSQEYYIKSLKYKIGLENSADNDITTTSTVLSNTKNGHKMNKHN